MTIESAVSKTKYIGNGETVEFAVPFKFLKNMDGSSQIAVYSGDDSVLLNEGTDYTVSGAGNNEGGEVLFAKAPVDGELIVIIRSIPATQKTRFIEGEDFPAAEFEESLDKIIMLIQEEKETLSRAVILKPTSDQDPERLLYETIESASEAMTASQEANDAAISAKEAAEAAKIIATDAVSTINTTRDAAVVVVENEGIQQSALVAKEGENQKTQITAATTEAISAVTAAGESQIDLVSQAGAEQVALAAAQAAAASASAVNAETYANNAAESLNLAQSSAQAAAQSSSRAAAVVNGFDTHVAEKQSDFDNHIAQKTVEAETFVAAEGEKQINLAAAQTEEARRWAQGTITERPDGSAKYWADVAKGQVLPDQAGNTGKFLATNGGVASWENVTMVQVEYLD